MRAFLVVLGLAGAGCEALAASHCPAGFIAFDPDERSYSTAALRESTDFESDAFAAWNLPAGHIEASVPLWSFAGYSEVQAVDRFRVIGLPQGTPLAFTARFRVQGWVSVWFDDHPGGAIVFATVQEGGASERWLFSAQVSSGPSTILVDTTLAISIQTAAYEEFELTYALLASATGAASSRFQDSGGGFLSFDGLPPGTAITSCQGFTQGPPVATLPSSWGSLKARYRK